MKNLFVLHTQYNLILSLALIDKEYASDENYLVLFQDFEIPIQMIESLKMHFCSVQIHVGSFYVSDLTWKKKMVRYRKLKKAFELDAIIYDNVFLVEDTVIPEQYIMRHSYRKNHNTKFGYIGDGADAYYTNIDPKKITGIARHRCLVFLRRIVFQYGMRLGIFYTYAECFGSSPLLNRCYELYPQLLRSELSDKEKYEIDGKHLMKATQNLYDYLPPCNLKDNALIIIMDKLTVYRDFSLFDKVMGEIIRKAKEENRPIYYKYHPVEKSEYPDASGWTEIDRNLPAEYIFGQATIGNTWVVGIMSTALQTAKKMGHEVTSYIESFDPYRTDVIELYKNIGIDVK